MPNRPGTLGAVASALGALGADISLVEIVDKRGEIEVEEFILDLPPTQTVEKLVAACDRFGVGAGGMGAQLSTWRRHRVRHRAAPTHRRRPLPSGQILASAAPLVFRAQWSVLIDASAAPQITFGTPGAPDLDADQLQKIRSLRHAPPSSPRTRLDPRGRRPPCRRLAHGRPSSGDRRPPWGTPILRLRAGATRPRHRSNSHHGHVRPAPVHDRSPDGSSQTSGNPALRARHP